jgi:hypothetical protein
MMLFASAPFLWLWHHEHDTCTCTCHTHTHKHCDIKAGKKANMKDH